MQEHLTLHRNDPEVTILPEERILLSLRDVLFRDSDIVEISIVNMQAQEIARASQQSSHEVTFHSIDELENFAERNEFLVTVGRRTTGVYVSPVYVTQEGAIMQNIAVPIFVFGGASGETQEFFSTDDFTYSSFERSPQEALGVVIIRVDLEGVIQIASSIVVGESGYTYVADREFVILAHPDRELISQNARGASIAEAFFRWRSEQPPFAEASIMSVGISEKGEEVLAAFRYLPEFRFGVVVQQPIAEVLAPLQRIYQITIFLLIASVTVTAIAGVWLSRHFVLPIRALREAVGFFTKGDLSHRVSIHTGDEMEQLADAFNSMAKELQQSRERLEEAKEVLEVKVVARTKELQDLNENLEEEVKRRTQEIHEKMKELERFQRVAVGRELKMIELKNELKELHQESLPHE
jgi:HAMP domain-containing protein